MTSEKQSALDAFFKGPAFATLGDRRINMFRQFAIDIEDKNPAEIAMLFLRLNKQLSREQPLTKAEREAVAYAIKESLSEEDRRKFNTVLKMI